MLGFHCISEAAISALVWRRILVAEVVSGGVAKWFLGRKRRWTVETPMGNRHFDTREEAWHYYAKMLEDPKPSRKAKKIRKLGNVQVKYLGKSISAIKVNGKRGIEVFREPSLSKELMRLIEIETALLMEEEEMMLLAIASIA